MEDSIKIRLTSLMNTKLRAMVQFCALERNKDSHQCECSLQCCEYSQNKPINLHPECKRMLSNILQFGIEDIINFGNTPHSSVPEDILKEAMKHRENVALGKEYKHLQTDNENHLTVV